MTLEQNENDFIGISDQPLDKNEKYLVGVVHLTKDSSSQAYSLTIKHPLTGEEKTKIEGFTLAETSWTAGSVNILLFDITNKKIFTYANPIVWRKEVNTNGQ